MLICDDGASARLSQEEIDRHPGHQGWLKEMRRRGVFVQGARLRPSGDAASVRVDGGQVMISDGPFAETKEQVAGFVLIECRDLDEAVEVASKHPIAATGTIEVREIL